LNHRTVTEDPRVMQFLMVLADNNTQIDAGITKTTPAWDTANIPVIIYFMVAAVLLFFMVKALTRLYALLKNHSCKNVGDVYLVFTRAKGTPFSFFRYIFWNEEIDLRSESGKRILEHELTHVQQKHSVDKIFMQLVLIAGWFNPFFWLIRKEMNMIHEFIADKKAVDNGDTAQLAKMLLLAAYPQQQFALTNPFFSPIKRRLQMLGNNRNPRFSYIRRLVVLPLLAVVIVLFAFRNKEQRIDATLSVASVMENVIEDFKTAPVQAEPASVVSSDTIITKNGKILKVDKTAEGVVTLKNLPDTGIEKIRMNKLARAYPVLIVDGQRVDFSVFDQLNVAAIDEVRVLKDRDAVIRYGPDAVNGVIEIVTKKDVRKFDGGTIVATTIPGIISDTGRIMATTVPIHDIAAVRESTMSITGLSGSISGGTFASNNGLTVKFPDSIVWTKDGTIPLILIDGVKSTLGDVKPTDISRVEVLKNDRAIAKYGNAGKTGAIEITTYKSMDQVRGTVTAVGTLANLRPVQNTNITTLGTLNALTVTGSVTPANRGNLSSMTVSGIITGGTYSGTLTATNVPAASANSLVPAEFPGGSLAWAKYLERALDKDVPIRNGAGPGRLTVIVSFMVAADGSVSNIEANNDPGFGTKEEALRVIRKGPKWKPASYNGSVVNYNHRVAINFILPDTRGQLDTNKLKQEPR
jgi:hypothetical protein